MNLQGLPALITGGASGLGAATARALAAKGAKVALLDVNLDAADALAKEFGGIGVKCDVTSPESAEAAIAAAAAAHGPARILVNCAGIANAIRTVGKQGPFPLDAFSRVIQVNLIGTFNMIRLAATAMSTLEHLGEERGVIINTASVAAFEGQIGQAAYSASKAGVAGMTLPIARDLAQFGIRVCTIAPGLFLTPMLMSMSEEARRSLGAQVPFPSRLGNPEEYAALAIHIAENPMLNGETIRLDGAIRMGPK